MSGFTFVKTFDPYTADRLPQTGQPAASGVWAVRITKFDYGAKLGFAEDNLRTIYVHANYRRRPGKGVEPFEIFIAGRVAFEYVSNPHDFDIFDGSLSTPNEMGAMNTSVNELDSGPINIAAGEVVPIIDANPGRIRGVTVQNVGLTSIVISKSGIAAALAGAGYILSPDTGVNVGDGGAVTFDGWQGPLFAANVAGGPGSVLVSAF